jgi:hypothetical protein
LSLFGVVVCCCSSEACSIWTFLHYPDGLSCVACVEVLMREFRWAVVTVNAEVFSYTGDCWEDVYMRTTSVAESIVREEPRRELLEYYICWVLGLDT